MKQDGLSFFSDTYLTLIGLMIFLGYFIFILIKAFQSSKNQIAYLKQIPFETLNETITVNKNITKDVL